MGIKTVGECNVCHRSTYALGLHRVFSNSGRKYWICNRCDPVSDPVSDPKVVLDKLHEKENCESLLNAMAACIAVAGAVVIAAGLLFMLLGMMVACCWGSPPWYGSSL